MFAATPKVETVMISSKLKMLILGLETSTEKLKRISGRELNKESRAGLSELNARAAIHLQDTLALLTNQSNLSANEVLDFIEIVEDFNEAIAQI